MKNIFKYLTNQGGFLSAGIGLASMIPGIIGGIKGNKAAAKATKQSGEEKALNNYTYDWLNRYRSDTQAPMTAARESFLQPSQDAAINGGLFGRISDAFSDRPNTSELEAIRGQENQLKNAALNSGA